MARFWVSWYQPGVDCRPLTFPPDERVLGWWVSGYGDRGTSICAVVRAPDEAGVKDAVVADWPETATTEWRFVNPVQDDWVPPGDRFPLSDWMHERITGAAPYRRGESEATEGGER